jgi:uncharacterized protein (TIGR03083 family)
MTMSTTDTTAREARLDRTTALRLVADEYNRYLELIRTLTADEWTRATECPPWDVRAMAAHNLGMAEFVTSPEENQRQSGAAAAKLSDGGVFIDALTGLQVEERAGMSATELIERYAEIAPQAVLARQYTPDEMRKSTLPVPQHVNGAVEHWTFGYILDVILTRDTWMHRVDTSRAVGRPMALTADHDGVLVADVVNEWAARHNSPYTLVLEGPAGGRWSHGTGGPEYQLDAVEFCRILSGRATGDGLLSTEVPF